MATTIVRIIMGLLLMFSSLAYFFKFMPEQPEMSETAKLFMTGLFAAGYMMPLIKVIELACAVAFLFNRFVPLATVIIFPITVNILLFHAFMAPHDMIIPILLVLANLWLAIVYRENYASLVAAR
jgi:putative oxidoreductase